MRSLRLLAVALAFQTAMAWGFPTAPYFPLVDNYSWSYNAGFGSVARTVLPGTVVVNGVATKVLQHSEDGYLQYVTSDANGIRLHQEASPADGETYLFSPPVVMAGGDALEGSSWFGSGALIYSGPFGTFPLAYESSSVVEALESINTYAGTFAAARLRWTFRLYGDIFGTPIDETSVSTLWVAEGVGLVYETSSTEPAPLVLSTLSFRPVLTFGIKDSIVFPSPQPANGQPGSVSIAVSIANNGTQPVNLAGISATGSFTAELQCNPRLDPGQSCFASARFQPSTPGSHTGMLVLQSDAVGSPFQLPLSGTASPAAIPRADPQQLDFGSVLLAGTSAPQTFTLTNAGTANLAIRSVFAGGDYVATHSCPATLAPAQSCAISVVFSPQPPGWGRRDSVVAILFDNFEVARLDVSVTGLALAPELIASPSALDFGLVPIGLAATRTARVANAALVPIQVTFVSPPVDPFAVSSDCVATIAPGAYCTLTATYAPGAEGAHNGSITINYQNGMLFANVPLSGTGIAPQPIQLLIRGPGNVPENTAAQYVAEAQWNDGNRVPVTPAWSSSDPARASIAADGTLTVSSLEQNVAVTLVAAYPIAEGSLTATWTLTAIDTASPPPALQAAVSPGWTLLGAGLATSTDVVTAFGGVDAPVPEAGTPVAAIWKWNAEASRWAFYSPLLSLRANTLYCAEYGYDLLSTLQPGEGFWVNALDTAILPVEIGLPLAAGNQSFAALPSGWNLLADGAGLSPSEYNVAVSPQAPGATVPQSFFSLWQWDPAQAKWWFYSPLLEASGGAAAVKSYAESNGYLDFETVYPPYSEAPKRLGVGEGFWVNKP